MITRQKELEVLKREFSEAVSECIDPARLVLDAASELPQSIRDRVAVVEESWRVKHAGKKGNTETKIAGGGVGDNGEMEGAVVRTFLQMVIAFDLRLRYEEDFLVKLVIENVPKKELVMVASRLRFNGKFKA
ncbi:hypothetical protein HPP92_019625 [Vanilla planifolia]|uniref:FRIGIDA-like protein n=1 Tax=Vanilla planifolia TaxID=51239 RepID=A0A835UN26_VANPL|nr:hypothetical protein HPP92_019625 [Vanilla planifolia]